MLTNAKLPTTRCVGRFFTNGCRVDYVRFWGENAPGTAEKLAESKPQKRYRSAMFPE